MVLGLLITLSASLERFNQGQDKVSAYYVLWDFIVLTLVCLCQYVVILVMCAIGKV